ncbi:MAG: autotransporter domain-containing protein [Verrucomicrobiota bacterium]
MLILLVWQENSYSQTSWTGAVDDKWQDGGNWTAGLPSATVSAFINNNGVVVLDSGAGNTSFLIVNDFSTLTVSNGSTLSAGRSSVGGGPSPSNSGMTINGTGSLVIISATVPLGIGQGTTANDTTGTVTVENGGELRILNGAVFLGGDNAVNPTTGVSTGKLILNGTAGNRGVMQLRQTKTSSDFGIIDFDGGILRAFGNESDFFQADALGTVTVTLNGGGGFIDTDGFNIGIDESITGTGALTKQGLGTLTLSASSSYLGGTTVQAGTLSLAHNNAVGTGAITTTGSSVIKYADGLAIANSIVLNSNGTQVRVNTGSATQSGIISEIGGARPLEKIGAGTLILSGNNSYSGGTTLSQGTLVVDNNNALGSGTLTIGNGTTLSSTAPRRITNDILLNGNFNIFPGGTLFNSTAFELDGNMDLGGGNRVITNTMDFNASESGQVNIGGVISNGGLTFASDLGLPQPNTVFFQLDGTLANNYAGDTVVGQGVSLSLNKSNNSIAIAGDVTINGGGLLVIVAREQIADSATVTLIDDGKFQVGVSSDVSETIASLGDNGSGLGKVDLSSNTIGSTLRLRAGNFSGEIRGGLAGGTSLEKYGSGTLVLSGSNSYLGDTRINGGILSVSADNNLGDSSSDLIFGGGTLQNTVVFSTARVTTLNAAGGTFQTGADLTHSGVISGAGSLTKTGASTLTLIGNNSYLGDTQLNGGTLSVSADNTLGNSFGSLTFDGGTLQNTAAFSTARAITLNAAGGTFLTGADLTHSGVISGSGSLTKTGSSTLTLSGSNSYLGGSLLNGGTLSVSADNNLGDSSGGLTFNGATLQNTAAFSMTRATTLNAAGGTFRTGANLMHSGIIGGAGSLTKTGASTLTLSGNNSYLGGTRLNDGILSVSADNNLGDSSGGFIIDGATLQNTAAFSAARGITLNAAGGTFQTDAALTHSGVIGGPGSLTKTGASSLTLSGSNSYLGGTQLNGGILSVSADNNLGDSSGSLIFGGGTLQNTAVFSTARATTLNAAGGTFQTGAVLTYSGIISGAGSLTKTGASTLILSGSKTYLGGTRLNGGILSVSADNSLGDLSGALTFGGGTLQNTAAFSTARATTLNAAGGIFQSGANLIHSGVIGGVGSLTKTGASTLILSANNAYSGGTTINSGTLRTTSLTALGNGSVVHNAGTLDPVGTLNTGAFTWNGGTIATDIGTTTDFIDATGSLSLGAPGEFDFTKVAGFSNNTFYKIFNADNLGVFDPAADFFGNALLGLDPIFSITGNDLFVNFLGTPFFAGAILQNSAPVGIPTFSDFIVNGAVTTGTPTENNIINGLIFNPSSSLRVFNTLTVTSGRFTVNAGTGTISGGRVVVPGDFNKDGAGKLILNDTVSVAGAARVKAGSLYVNGTFTTGGGLTVFQNALLGGSGIINGNVVNNGTVNPGNSPGTLTINGNFTQSSSGTLQIEVASPSVFDRLVVRDNAALAGTLQAINFAGNQLDYGQQLDFLQAGSISGDFDRILMPDPDRFRGRFLAEGGTGTLLVAPTSYTLVAETANQRSVARALDSYISERGNDRETVSIALDIQSEGQYAAAFDAITPAFYENLTDIIVEQAVAHNQMLVQRMSAIRLGSRGFSAIGIEASPLRYDRSGKDVMGGKESGPISAAHAPRWSTWVQASGIFAKLSNTSQMPSLNFQTGGVLIGADHTFGESVDAGSGAQDQKLTVGAYIGYDYTWIDNAGDSNSRISSALFGAYAIYENGGFYAETILGGGHNDYRMRRSIAFSTVDRTARSSPDGGQFNAYQDLGYDWRAGGFTIGVLAGSQYTYAGISSFSENGAESLDLRLDRQEVNSIRTNIGGRIAYAWDLGPNLVVIPELRVFWQHEFLQDSREIGTTLDGGKGSSFDYETEALGQDGIQAGAGVSARFSRDWSAYLYYNTNFARQDYLSHSVSTGLEWRF